MRWQIIQWVALLGYLLAGWLVVRRMRGWWRELAFAALNLAALYLFFFVGEAGANMPAFLTYLGVVTLQYVTLRLFATRGGSLPWVAFATPIVALILVRYTPLGGPLHLGTHLLFTPLFVGISYLAFRSSYLVLEVRNKVTPLPGFLEYVGFCFFAPTMAVGPINPYSNHRRGFAADAPVIPWDRACLRILVGVVKYKFLGSHWFRLSYANLLFDDHYHPLVDLPVAMLFYYLYLYCNFSGFCDIAIGSAGLMGIPVAENFNNPFAARNVKDFWNRWHITLSQYMRDLVFAPLSKFLVRIAGPKRADHAIAATIAVVFLLVGVWHGVGWNFAAYGAVHALGVVANHYYTIGLKRWLGRDGFKAYNANPWIHAVAVAGTFVYCGASLLFFANTFPQIREIAALLK